MVSGPSRRSVLEAVGATSLAALAGCLGLGEPDWPTLTLEADPVPAGVDARPTAGVVRQFADDHPAAIRVAFANASGERRTFELGASPPFSGLVGQPTGGREGYALLVPLHSEVHVAAEMPGLPAPTAVIPDEPEDGCWRAEATIRNDPVVVKRTLAPTETIDETYALLAGPRQGSCPLSGEYRFESNSYFDDKWRFTVTVEDG